MASLWASTSRALPRLCPRAAIHQSRTIVSTPPAPASSLPSTSPKPHPISSCPAGTVLTGLEYLKDQPALVARDDSEYPDWLWTLVDDPAKAKVEEKGKRKGKGKKHEKEREMEEIEKRARLAREIELEKSLSEEERLRRLGEAIKVERRTMRKENRDKIRMQNFMKTT